MLIQEMLQIEVSSSSHKWGRDQLSLSWRTLDEQKKMRFLSRLWEFELDKMIIGLIGNLIGVKNNNVVTN